MATIGEYAGECPECGDELYINKTKSYKRFIKCINDTCEFKGYGIPKSGSIEVEGCTCHLTGLPLLAIVKNARLRNGSFKKMYDSIYFYTNKPCFTCRFCSKCADLLEAKMDYPDYFNEEGEKI